MRNLRDVGRVEVVAPCFKRRLSGVTSTVFRLVPVQARDMEVAVAGPAVPEGIPQVRLRDLVLMPRRGPGGPRVWHARRNFEMLGGLALRTLGKDLRLVFTSASQRRHTRFTKWLIRRMDAVVSTSAKTAAYLERPSVVVHHGIDAEAFRPVADRAALRVALGLPAEGPLVGCFGRIRAQKGTDLFVEAMIAVLRDRPDGGAILLGRATREHRDFQRDLEAKVAAAGLAGRIRFLGEAPVGEMARWYGALDLFVAPQRWEGFGVTPIEAMACGVPVVATRVGAFEEQVVDGATGLLIPAELEAMTEAVREALADPARLARWGEAARARVVAEFRLEDEAARLNALYRELLERGRLADGAVVG
ncbi:glycosyltransferase family 4 protein [Rubellimicrobium aerolatum]|uniref:Glycosyltransferase family 4 protein n=1 Tax=Rubellimicrobium aerolatum TaxID=490979 RepID=A0ABW0S7K0_9RHOB|nr:glycosyltransferase family 4 protein [Rubellimicrobium aerolatum]MBP1804559.1 mannosyltransferase [Rubellimicrobium aerolatum]